jgi:hypothetical protein
MSDMQTPPPAAAAGAVRGMSSCALDIETAITFPPLAQHPRRRASRSTIAAWPSACERERRAPSPITQLLPRVRLLHGGAP